MDAAVTSAVTQNSCAKWARYDAGVKQATTAWVCAAGLVVVIAGCGDGAATDTDGTDDVPAPDAALLCLPIDARLHRAAAHVARLDVRRVIACAAREAVGVIGGLDFARVVAG